MGKQVKGLDEQAYRYRGVQTEGFVADDMQVWTVDGKMVGNEGDVLVVTDEDGDAAWTDALLQEMVDGRGDLLEHCFLIVLLRKQQDADKALGRTLLGYLLADVSISMAQCFGTKGVFLVLGVVLLLGCFSEEGIIELDDMSLGAVVGLKGENVYRLVCMGKLLVDGVEQPPVAGTPAVDALFDVTDYQVLGVDVTHAFLQ